MLLPLLVYVAIVQCLCHAFDTSFMSGATKLFWCEGTRVGPVWAIYAIIIGMYPTSACFHYFFEVEVGSDDDDCIHKTTTIEAAK